MVSGLHSGSDTVQKNHAFSRQALCWAINLILSVIGSPTADDLSCIRNKKARSYLEALPYKPTILWMTLFLKADANGKMLEEALARPYLEEWHDPNDEPVAEGPFTFEAEWMIYPRIDSKNWSLRKLLILFQRQPRIQTTVPNNLWSWVSGLQGLHYLPYWLPHHFTQQK